MTVTVLGVSAFYHDSAAAIVRDGEILAAAQEERFTRKKNDPRFPRNAINYCLEEAFVEPSELDAVVFYDNPLKTFDRVVKSLLTVAPSGEDQWRNAAPSMLAVKFDFVNAVRRNLNESVPVLFTRHHLAHAASTFYPSPFERAAILTMDGVGEWATTSISVGEGEAIKTLKEIHYPHSLGLLYSAFTYYCGFKVNSGEYKLMGLAPYGKPIYADQIRKNLIEFKPDGSFRLNLDYFGYLDTDKMTNDRFHALFGGPPRSPESRITRRDMDLAASIQEVTEEAVMGLARYTRELTGMPDVCLAGGVALNCVANGRLEREGVFDRVWIQPAAGDAGGAVGAALVASHRHFNVPRQIDASKPDGQKGSFLGPGYSSREVRSFLDERQIPYERVENRDERARRTAEALAKGQIVGLFSGRMEFGPRALGARSILGDARNPETQEQMNLKIKFRESFRPFAPAVLAESAPQYFDIDCESPYMLLVAPVREDRRMPQDLSSFDAGDDDMLPIVRQARSDIPAVTHIDYSARLQTVSATTNPEFHAILKAFEEITGYGVLVNTSFNVRGEPIVCTPEDAYRCFMHTEMEWLVMEDCILEKAQQPELIDDDWGREYELD